MTGIEEVRARFREARASKGLTQVQVAAAVGMAPATIAALEGGERVPGWETMDRVATHLGMKLEVRLCEL